DSAGNVSAPGPVFTVTIDTQAPATPAIDAVSDSQLTNGTLYSRDGTPTLSGTGEPGTIITVTVDGTASTMTATVQADGTWEWTSPVTLTDAPHTFSVAANDPAGLSSGSSPTLNVTVDTLDPAAPTGISVAAQGTPMTGSAEAGSTITVTDADGNVVGTGVATSGGSFSVALSPAQPNG
ncbi:type 1 secretion target domain protein, partial [Escherichia coli]